MCCQPTCCIPARECAVTPPSSHAKLLCLWKSYKGHVTYPFPLVDTAVHVVYCRDEIAAEGLSAELEDMVVYIENTWGTELTAGYNAK